MSATATEKATAARLATIDEFFHKALCSYEKALKSGIQLQKETVNLWKDLLTVLGSAEEFQAKLASMTADAFRRACKRMSVDTFNSTSNQTIDLSEKNKTETEQLEKVLSIGLGFDADVNKAKAALLEGRIPSGSEDPQTLGVYQATSVPNAQRRVQDLIEPKGDI